MLFGLAHVGCGRRTLTKEMYLDGIDHVLAHSRWKLAHASVPTALARLDQIAATAMEIETQRKKFRIQRDMLPFHGGGLELLPALAEPKFWGRPQASGGTGGRVGATGLGQLRRYLILEREARGPDLPLFTDANVAFLLSIDAAVGVYDDRDGRNSTVVNNWSHLHTLSGIFTVVWEIFTVVWEQEATTW